MTKKKHTRSQITRSRWLRGRLGYKFHEGQKDLEALFFSKPKGQIFVSECGRQFGKTFFWVVICLQMAFRKPNARIKFGTAFLTDLVEFIIPAFDAALIDCPEDLRPVYKVSGSKYVCRHNGAEIKLVGLDMKPNSMRGNAIDLIIIDEGGFTDRLGYLYRSVIIPATTHRPECRVVLSSSTPAEEDHEFFAFVEKAQFEDAYVLKTIHDNPMVDETNRKRLAYEVGGEESEEWQREYLCKRVRNRQLTIIPDWEDKYVQDFKTDIYHQFYQKYVAMDLGVRVDRTAVLLAYYDFKQAKLFIEDEYAISGPEMTTDLLQAHLKRKEIETWCGIRDFEHLNDKIKIDIANVLAIEAQWDLHHKNVRLRISDNNNPLLLQDLSIDHKLHFSPTDKERLEEMVNAVKIMVRSGGIIVHPRCKQVAGCLKFGRWDKKRIQFDRSPIYGHFDALAALVYLVRNLDRVTNPIPIDFQADQDNQVIFKFQRDSSSIRALKGAFGFKG